MVATPRFSTRAIPLDATIVLRVAGPDAADGTHAHAVEVRAGLRGIALEVAMQGALALRGGQLVVRPREMVHADVKIPCAQKSLEARAKDPEFLHSFGQPRGQRALLLTQPRDMRVAEHGHAVRRERDHLLDCVGESLGGLQREAVD
jgi:hypothetical protein